MKFAILRETPDNSGQYADEGDTFEGAAAEVFDHLADLQALTGSRHAAQYTDPIRRAPIVSEPATPAPVTVTAEPAAAE